MIINDFQRCSKKHYQTTQSMYDPSKHKIFYYRFSYFYINSPKSRKENNLTCFASISSTTKSTLPPFFPCTRATRIPPTSPQYLHARPGCTVSRALPGGSGPWMLWKWWKCWVRFVIWRNWVCWWSWLVGESRTPDLNTTWWCVLPMGFYSITHTPVTQYPLLRLKTSITYTVFSLIM